MASDCRLVRPRILIVCGELVPIWSIIEMADSTFGVSVVGCLYLLLFFRFDNLFYICSIAFNIKELVLGFATMA